MDVRSVSNTAATAKPARPVANGPAAPAPAPVLTTDSYVSTVDDAAKAIAVVNEAAALPPLPTDAADKQAWLNDGYARLTRAELAGKTIRAEESKGTITSRTASDAIFKTMDLRRALRQADPTGAGEKAYFAELAKPAAAIIENLKLSPVPATKVGQKAWLAANGGKVQRAEAARAVVEDAWMHGGVSFEAMGKLDDKLFAASCKVDSVKNALYPPKPGPKGAPSSGSHPIFGATQGVGQLLDHKDPFSQTAGAVALPFAVMFDMLDLISRPLIALDKLQQKK
ncbi:MAG: hypothetical protein JWM80_2721 [Cyanobacteria bacterium RYN_339]|nr:hypothetical protein [Cyanobacteria bacterium RYN_339]